MRNIILSFGLFSIVGCQSCIPTPTPSPTPPTPTPAPIPSPVVGDASPTPVPPTPVPTGDIWDQACANIKAQNCPEGVDPKCAQSFRNAVSNNISPNTLSQQTGSCLVSAKSKSAIVACGFVKCSN